MEKNGEKVTNRLRMSGFGVAAPSGDRCAVGDAVLRSKTLSGVDAMDMDASDGVLSAEFDAVPRSGVAAPARTRCHLIQTQPNLT